MKIGIDIDGVILDFERTMQTYAELYDLLILKKSGKINNNFSYLDKYDWTIDDRIKCSKAARELYSKSNMLNEYMNLYEGIMNGE